MSTIGSNPRIDQTSLNPFLDRVGADDLRQRNADGAPQADTQGQAPAETAAASGDLGPDVLMSSAWDGIPEGQRLLSGDAGFERDLGGMELSAAAEAGAEAVSAFFG